MADSLIWDAHKMLRTSGVVAAVLLKRESDLAAGLTVEGTKAALGLKVFLNLAWRGERGLAAYVAGRYALAHRLWELARRRPGFDLPYEPESNVVCLRYGDGDQDTLRERMMNEGTFHVTATELGGRRYLRVSVMAPATDEKTLHALLDRITVLHHAP